MNMWISLCFVYLLTEKEIHAMSFTRETPIPKANNLKVTIGVAELVS
jgi:hypothetical protein